jgi:hypothetical protein
MNKIPPILQIGHVLISSDILTEQFCCDLAVCHGACCVEGEAGAPVTLDEVMEIEQSLEAAWGDLSASAQAVIDRQGVAYTDEEGDLVTSIVGGKDCVFTCYDSLSIDGQQPTIDCCLCALERACRKGRTTFLKPISCALYPIREKTFSDGTVGLNYHRWDICQCGRDKGKALGLPVYRFLKEPLIRRFGPEWYEELSAVAHQILSKTT